MKQEINVLLKEGELMFNHSFRVKDGEPITKFANQAGSYIKTLKDGDYVMSIQTLKSMKSKEQRGYWYGVVYDKFFKTEGWTRLEFDDYFIQKFGAQTTITDRLTNREKIIFKGVSGHTQEEMSKLIDDSVLHCRHDLGLDVPDPVKREVHR